MRAEISVEEVLAADAVLFTVTVRFEVRTRAALAALGERRARVRAEADVVANGLVGRDLSEIITAAVSEVEKTRTITTSLVSMEGDIESVEKGNGEAVAASQEIAAAIAQVKVAVDQVSQAAQEAEKAAEQAASAAKQQSQGAEELSAAIEEIASLADELQSN